jgi:hypothetical protein
VNPSGDDSRCVTDAAGRSLPRLDDDEEDKDSDAATDSAAGPADAVTE